MKIICVSDTHRQYKKLKISEADVFIHCGDIDCYEFSSELKKFNKWLGTVPCKHKLIIAGNHDGYFDKHSIREIQKRLTNGIYLENTEVIIDGVKFYGSPYTPIFGNWWFMLSSDGLLEAWSKIPEDTDILITHGPPFEILDKSRIGYLPVGCSFLAKRVKEIKPKAHVFGHIHGEYGIKKTKETVYINSSSMDEDYCIVNKPIEFNINPITKEISINETIYRRNFTYTN